MIKRVVLGCLVMMAFTAIAYASGSLTYGSTNDDIYAMQERLKELGFFDEESTGYFGDATRTAIKNFQKANGMQTTGVADGKTVDAMKAENAVTKQQYLQSANSVTQISMTLSPGEKNKYVKKLQNMLLSLGYFKGDVTGYYGTVTQNAVMFFQLINSLPVTGVADGDTLTKLSNNGAIPAGTKEEELTLRIGDTGSDVKTLQTYLRDLGYFTGECSGRFGNVTQTALLAYQQANGLDASGECDIATRLLMLSGNSISMTAASEADAVKEFSQGDINSGVKTVKSQLYKLGYYSGEMDDQFGADLKNALALFQTANDLAVTGCADTATRQYLNEGKGISQSEYANYMSVAEVQFGDSGYAVTLMQTRLSQLGYYSAEINGNFDKETQKALIFFQRGHQMTETGVADENTRRLMNSVDALTYAVAEKLYYERVAVQQREAMLQKLIDMAQSLLGCAFEPGKEGPKSFGNAGFTKYCYGKLGFSLEDTSLKQFSYAESNGYLFLDESQLQTGDQVFFRRGETVYTGIYMGDKNIAYASQDYGMVVSSNTPTNGEFTFLGAVRHF